METLGGHQNPFETKRPSDIRMESEESRQEFGDFRKKFNRMASRIFLSGDDTMSQLRLHPGLQAIKMEGDYENQDRLEVLANQFSEMIKTHDLVDTRDLAALISVLAQADRLQDERLHKQGVLKQAA